MAHRDHKHILAPAQLFKARDEAPCFGPDGIWIAIVAGIYYRTMRSLDEIHQRVPDLCEL